MSKAKSSSSGSSGVQLSSGISSSIATGSSRSGGTHGKRSDSSLRDVQAALRARADDDSDYEEDGPEDDSLDIARRTHNQHLSDAFKDGFRDGFDKGQIQLAQNVFNTSHSLAAKSQVPYGQYLGLVKVLDQKMSSSSPNAVDLRNFISQTEAFNSPSTTSSSSNASTCFSSSSEKATMTKSVLLNRLSQLKKIKTVQANSQLVEFISEIETRLSSLQK